MTRSQICIRLKSMLRSPNVNMIRTGQGNKARYHLIGVNERFYELGEVNFRPAGKKTKAGQNAVALQPNRATVLPHTQNV